MHFIIVPAQRLVCSRPFAVSRQRARAKQMTRSIRERNNDFDSHFQKHQGT